MAHVVKSLFSDRKVSWCDRQQLLLILNCANWIIKAWISMFNQAALYRIDPPTGVYECENADVQCKVL